MVIKEIKIKKKRVEIICDNESFEISLESYMNNYILIGNEIDRKEISRLLREDEIHASRVELINKLSKKKLSKRECINFLSSSNLKDQIVDKKDF